MSQLLSKIESDLLRAQKDGDTAKTSILRFLLSKIRNNQIDKGKDEPLTDEEILKEISAEVRRHAESIEFAQKGKRADLVDKEKAELAILESYLPEKLSQKEISKMVEDAISETGAKTSADFGKLMGAVMPKIAGRAEGSQVAEIVKRMLTK